MEKGLPPDITPEPLDAPPSERQPWVPPTIESLHVSETMIMFGVGGDAGVVGCTLS
jgi:hypothetical protein